MEIIDGDNLFLAPANSLLEKAMADEEDELPETELSYDQKKEIAKWFLLNAPAGEINYVAKGTYRCIIHTYLRWCILFLRCDPV